MNGKKLFEYAVIRIVPQVYREEFMNVGVILYCSKEKFLDMCFLLDENRLKAFFPGADLKALNEYLGGMEEIAAGNQGTIGKLVIAERFRWLTATRSSLIQCSKVHPGLCEDAGEMLDRLFKEMVEVKEKEL